MIRRRSSVFPALVTGVATVCSVLLVGCTAPAGNPPTSSIRMSGARVLRSVDGLIADSVVIATGRITEVDPARWNTEDGRLPAGVGPGNLPPGLTIIRDSRFRITETLKGNSKGAVVPVRTSGGTVDGVTLAYEDKVPLEQGKDYLLFLGEDDRGGTHLGAAFFPMRAYAIEEGRASSADDEWVLDELLQHVRATLAEPDPSGVGDFLARRYAEAGVPLASLKAVGAYVEVIYMTDATPAVDTPQDELYRFLIATEIELARQYGHAIGSYGIGAQDAAGDRFRWWYGPTQPDEALWLDKYPSAFTDEETGMMIREGLELQGLALLGVEVSSEDGLQTVVLDVTAASADAGAEVVVGFAHSLRGLLDAINAQGAHVVRSRFVLKDEAGTLLVDNMRDLRVGIEGGWQAAGMPLDWRSEAEKTAEPY